MTWFRVDDALALHPKAHAAGNAALGLWVRAGSWSAQQLLDGKVPAYIVPSLDGKARDCAKLVTVGLWTVIPDGWQFHDWEKYQRTREQVLAEREKARIRQESHRGHGVTNGVTNAVTNGVSHATRTNPVHTSPSLDMPPEVRRMFELNKRVGSPDAVWRSLSESEREEHVKKARRLTAVPSHCPEHRLEMPCVSCAADRKAESA